MSQVACLKEPMVVQEIELTTADTARNEDE